MALTTDTSNLTAIANDYSYDVVFEKQVQGLGRTGDVLLGISTSGNSKNVIKAAEAARVKGMKVISMTGGTGGKLREISDVNLNVELGKNSSRIQETHIFIVHSLVDLMDRFFLKE
jgi:D-sedoheptulose 7-phosphate isomerase